MQCQGAKSSPQVRAGKEIVPRSHNCKGQPSKNNRREQQIRAQPSPHFDFIHVRPGEPSRAHPDS